MKTRNTLFLLQNILFFCLIAFGLAAQNLPPVEWAKSIGAQNYDYCYDLAVDIDGNVYATGYFQGTVDFDPGPGVTLLNAASQAIFVTKFDASGNFVWAKSIGESGYNVGTTVAVEKETGNIYLAGHFEGTADFDPGPETFYLSSTAGSLDGFVCKLDASGNFLWAKTFEGAAYNTVSYLLLDSAENGAIYLTGHFEDTVDFDPGSDSFPLSSAIGSMDAYVCKLDTAGNFIWAGQLGGLTDEDDCYGRRLTLSANGNYVYLVGSFSGKIDFDPNDEQIYGLIAVGGTDAYICKLDAAGNFVWAGQMGDTGFDKGMAIALDPVEGGIYLTGVFQGTVDFDPGVDVFELESAGDFDIFFTKLDADGNLIWAKRMGGSSYEYPYALVADQAGDLYMTGYFTQSCDFNPHPANYFYLTSSGDYEIFIAKLTGNGAFVWAERMGSGGADVGLALALDETQNLFVTGVFYSSQFSFDSIALVNAFAEGFTGDIFIAKLSPLTSGLWDASKTDITFSVSPNPAEDQLLIALPEGWKRARVRVLNASGQEVLALPLPASHVIPLRDMPSGSYFICLQEAEKRACVKFIKK